MVWLTNTVVEVAVSLTIGDGECSRETISDKDGRITVYCDEDVGSGMYLDCRAGLNTEDEGRAGTEFENDCEFGISPEAEESV